MMNINMHSSAGLRRWAMQCAAAADDINVSGDERDRLLTMRKALLELADAQDWLDGKGQSERATAIKQTGVIKISA